jgi:hypothetical protein
LIWYDDGITSKGGPTTRRIDFSDYRKIVEYTSTDNPGTVE